MQLSEWDVGICYVKKCKCLKWTFASEAMLFIHSFVYISEWHCGNPLNVLVIIGPKVSGQTFISLPAKYGCHRLTSYTGQPGVLLLLGFSLSLNDWLFNSPGGPLLQKNLWLVTCAELPPFNAHGWPYNASCAGKMLFTASDLVPADWHQASQMLKKNSTRGRLLWFMIFIIQAVSQTISSRVWLRVESYWS